MAPSSRPAGRKEAAHNYTNVGQVGRRTGVTLKDTGIRDENGLEPIDGIFSSPERPSPRVNGGNRTLTSDDMEVGESSIPEPTDVINGRRRKSYIPPPHSRSPIKTKLGSSPRRSNISSPAKHISPPNRSVPQHSVKRRLNFSGNRPANEASVNSSVSPKKARRTLPGQSSSPARPYSSPSSHRSQQKGRPKGGSLEFSDEEGSALEEDDDSVLMIQDTEPDASEALDEQESEEELQASVVHVKSGNKKSKPSKQPPPIQNKTSKKGFQTNRKRPTKALLVNNVEGTGHENSPASSPRSYRRRQPAIQIDANKADASVTTGSKRLRSTRTKPISEVIDDPPIQDAESDEQSEEEEENPRSTKRTRTSQKSNVEKQKGSRRGKSAKQPLEQNTTSQVNTQKGKSKAPEIPAGRVSRTLTIIHKEVTTDKGTATVSRYGRHLIKPIEYWKGETAIYTDDVREQVFGDKRFRMPTIAEVHRVEEIQPERKVRRPRNGKSRRSKRGEASEDDDELDDWERYPGILNKPIKLYDADLEQPMDKCEDADIAFAASAITTRDVKGSTFKFAKTLSTPYFGAGIVDLPPKGIKKPKNARMMQMVFFVFTGRVQVQVNDDTFNIGKGGMWQVPRGNLYSISNPNSVPARIFFSQGCEGKIPPAVMEQLAQLRPDDDEEDDLDVDDDDDMGSSP